MRAHNMRLMMIMMMMINFANRFFPSKKKSYQIDRYRLSRNQTTTMITLKMATLFKNNYQLSINIIVINW